MASILSADALSNVNTVVNIGNSEDETYKNLYYDVSSFLSEYDSMGSQWHNNLGNFIEKLDDKIKIDVNHEVHKPVVDGIDYISGIICAELPKFSDCYAGIKRYKSGSMYAGLRVGRPYEGDIVLETTQGINTDIIFRFVNIIKVIINEIHLDNWIIHGVKDMFLGANLVLEYKPNGEEQEGVGVLVDLVLARTAKGQIELHELNEHADNFLKSVEKQIDFHKYNLWKKGERFDSVYVQHQLLKNLPEEVKCAYRVAKYILQSGMVLDKPCVDVDSRKFIPVSYCLSKEQSCQLYGYKTLIKSHVLQMCLLHLLIQTHDTQMAHKLKGNTSALTLCLLDMTYLVIVVGAKPAAIPHNYHEVLLSDPICVNMEEVISLLEAPLPLWIFLHETTTLIKPLFDIISCRFMKHVSMGTSALKYYTLCNRPNHTITRIISDFSVNLKSNRKSKQWTIFESKLTNHIAKIYQNHYPAVVRLNLTGFCRGARPEFMAAAHDDKTEKDKVKKRLVDYNALETLCFKLLWNEIRPELTEANETRKRCTLI